MYPRHSKAVIPSKSSTVSPDFASQHSTGGKTSLGAITKAGDRYLRQLLVVAATGMIRRVRTDATLSPWLAELLRRMPAKQAAVALANKLARTAWAMLVSGESYRDRATA